MSDIRLPGFDEPVQVLVAPDELDARKEFALAQGVDPTRMRAVKMELGTLRKNGILVDLDITGTTMFNRAATWLEIGVLDPTTKARIKKGRKSFLPDKVEGRLISTATRMRQVFNNLAYPITGFAPYRWLSWTTYRKWRDDWDRLEADFYEIKAEILERYDDYFVLAQSDFHKIALASWKALKGQGYAGAQIDGVVFHNQDEFAGAVVALAMAKFPTRGKIEDELQATYVTALVYSDQDYLQEQLAAERFQDELDLQRAETRVREIEIVNQVRLAEAQARQELDLMDLEHTHRRAAIEAMQSEEMARARERMLEITSPLVEVISHLRNMIAIDVEKMLDSIKKNGHIRGKIAEKGRSLMELYQLMAAHDDKELRAKLEELAVKIGPDGTKDRNVDSICSTLEQIVELSHASVMELEEVGRVAFIEL